MVSLAGMTFPSIEHAECPYPLYERFREEGPAFNVPGTNTWIVSRWQDIKFVGRHNELFSCDSRRGVQPFNPTGDADGQRTLSIFELDPPEHKPRRDACFRSFAPGVLRGYEPMVHRIADELIDGFVTDGRADLVSQFATLLPTGVMMNLLGFTPDDLGWLLDWGLVETSGIAFQPPEEQERQRLVALYAGEKITEAILDRVDRPRDDIISQLLARQVERDGGFNLAVVRADASSIFRGGIITTAHAIAMAMLLLLEHPDQLAEVDADHAKIPRMFEEALRLEDPVQWNPRIATRDVDIGGVLVPAGAYVVIVFGSGNRDPSVFEDPEVFAIGRKNATEHLAFGYGNHFCLGAPLARLEGRVAFEHLLGRLQNIRLAPGNDLTHIKSAIFRGLNRLVVEFEPRAAGTV